MKHPVNAASDELRELFLGLHTDVFTAIIALDSAIARANDSGMRISLHFDDDERVLAETDVLDNWGGGLWLTSIGRIGKKYWRCAMQHKR